MSPVERPICPSDAASAAIFVDRAVDFILSRPLSRFVSPDRVLRLLEASRAAPLGDRALRLHAGAFGRRDWERSKTRGDHLGDYLTPELLALLRRELRRPLVLDRVFLETFVKQEAIRHLLRSIVEETLQRFVQALKPGGKNGLWGGLPKGPGMGLLSRMAEQIEAQIQRAAAAFVSTSLEVLLGRLVHILATRETAEQLGRLRLAGFEALIGMRTSTAWRLVHELPIDELLALLPSVVRHNLAREEIRVAIRAEVESILAEEGPHTLGDLLGAEGGAEWRSTLGQILPALLLELLETMRTQTGHEELE